MTELTPSQGYATTGPVSTSYVDPAFCLNKCDADDCKEFTAYAFDSLSPPEYFCLTTPMYHGQIIQRLEAETYPFFVTIAIARFVEFHNDSDMIPERY